MRNFMTMTCVTSLTTRPSQEVIDARVSRRGFLGQSAGIK